VVLSQTYAWRGSEIRKAANTGIVHALATIQTRHLNTSQKHHCLGQLAHPCGIFKAIYTFVFAQHHFNPFFLHLGILGHKQVTMKLGFLCSLNLFSYILSMFFFISPTDTVLEYTTPSFSCIYST